MTEFQDNMLNAAAARRCRDAGDNGWADQIDATLAVVQQLAEQATGQPIDTAAIDYPVAGTLNAGLEYLRRRYCSP